MHCLIAGGGIGGLTAALCLAQHGHEVTVLEQNPAFTEAGAGIQLSPNCSRVLHALGLEARLQSVAFLPEATEFRHWRSGKLISESPLGAAATRRYGAPYYHIHRGDLLSLLREAAEGERRIRLVTDTRVLGFEESNTGVLAKSNRDSHSSDILIGADGIHSVIQRELWGESAPSFTGNIAWRALVATDRLPEGLVRPVTTAWWGPNRHFVHYYVRGGQYVNCVCVVEKSTWQEESWTEPGDPAELKADFDGWHENIQRLIEQAEPDSLYKWGLFDRSPMPAWGRGRISLLGDACHPTLPFMAQGAAMAIEDAWVLAAVLSEQANPLDALQIYESLRRERTAGVQNGSRRNARVFHLSGVKAWLRDRAVRAAGSRTMDRLYEYDVLSVAERLTKS